MDVCLIIFHNEGLIESKPADRHVIQMGYTALCHFLYLPTLHFNFLSYIMDVYLIIFQILQDPFFDGYCPANLPISSLTTAPRFPDMPSTSVLATARKPLAEYNRLHTDGVLTSIPEGKKTDPLNNVSHAVCVKDGIGHDVVEDPEMEEDAEPDDYYLEQLLTHLSKCLESKPADRHVIQMGMQHFVIFFIFLL